MNSNKHVYIKAVHFERNVQSGDFEIIVDSNHGRFVLREDVIDFSIIVDVYSYIKEQATTVIQRYIADTAQQELEKTSADRARESLGKISKKPEVKPIEIDEQFY